jgi:hypothetical protein
MGSFLGEISNKQAHVWTRGLHACRCTQSNSTSPDLKNTQIRLDLKQNFASYARMYSCIRGKNLDKQGTHVRSCMFHSPQTPNCQTGITPIPCTIGLTGRCSCMGHSQQSHKLAQLHTHLLSSPADCPASGEYGSRAAHVTSCGAGIMHVYMSVAIHAYCGTGRA